MRGQWFAGFLAGLAAAMVTFGIVYIVGWHGGWW